LPFERTEGFIFQIVQNIAKRVHLLNNAVPVRALLAACQAMQLRNKVTIDRLFFTIVFTRMFVILPGQHRHFLKHCVKRYL